MLGGDGETHIGTPLVGGASVVAEVIEHLRGKKILVFKYKNKVRYRRRHGHRQDYTRLSIKEIVTSSGSVSAEEKPRRRRVEVKVDADQEEPVTEATTDAPEAEPTPRRRPAVRAKSDEPTTEADGPEAEASTEEPARRTRVRKAEPEGEAQGESDKPGRRSRAAKPDAEGEGE